MHKEFYYTMLAGVLFFIFVFGGLTFGAKQAENRVFLSGRISWRSPYMENDMKIIPGWVRVNSGKLEFRWTINQDGIARLEAIKNTNAGKKFAIDKQIFLLVRDDGKTLLFQKQSPLVNVNEPSTMLLIVAVSTKDLFSVLPKTKISPMSVIKQQTQPITWGKEFVKKDIRYLPGSLKASFGTLNIYWKKEVNRNPELITMKSPGAGELPPNESSLYLWVDELTGNTVIMQERQPQLNKEFAPYLLPLAVVNTDDLMARLKQTNFLLENSSVNGKQTKSLTKDHER
ncbi:MAG: hypothetical protein ACM3YE_07480 [Bacteroidota bacterium]